MKQDQATKIRSNIDEILSEHSQDSKLRANELKKKLHKQWELDQHNGSRVYKLKGYTTESKIKARYNDERKQRLVAKSIIVLLTVIIFAILIAIYQPFKNFSELNRILGEENVLNPNVSIEGKID